MASPLFFLGLVLLALLQKSKHKWHSNFFGIGRFYSLVPTGKWYIEGEFRDGAVVKGWNCPPNFYCGHFFDKSKKPVAKITETPDALTSGFKRLSQVQRKRLQTNLKKLDLYKSSIDGLYGKGTAGALSAYNKQNHNNSDLKKAANVSKLMDAVLAHKFVPDPDAIATIKPTEPPKAEPEVQTKPTEKPKVAIKPQPTPDETRKVASGTGFYVSAEGHIVTNHHVIDGCQEMKVHSKGRVFDTVKIASDVQNDLALLQIEISPSHVFALSQDSPYPLQNIIVAGFPFGHRYSSSLKFTQGIVSSLTGVGNNYSEIQIDAALQPGNSGGPIMDEAGNIVGVAVAKLALKQIVDDYGVVPENTNFGVKTSAVRNLMEGNQVPIKSPSTVKPSKADLSRMATAGTVYLTCWMTTAQIEQMRTKKVLFSELE